jgi:hypothetical protein
VARSFQRLRENVPVPRFFLLFHPLDVPYINRVDSVVDTNNPDTAFRWDPTGQQWIFNIATGNLSAGSTYYIYTITLNDGSTIIFQYGLR